MNPVNRAGLWQAMPSRARQKRQRVSRHLHEGSQQRRQQPSGRSVPHHRPEQPPVGRAVAPEAVDGRGGLAKTRNGRTGLYGGFFEDGAVGDSEGRRVDLVELLRAGA